MGDNNVDGDGGGVDGDGSGGNSLSQQGARTETSVPQNWSSIAAALQNFSWTDADSFRVFASEIFIGRRAMSEGTRGATPGGVATSWPSSVSALDSVSC
jgi:hypothetical protein